MLGRGTYSKYGSAGHPLLIKPIATSSTAQPSVTVTV